MATLEELIIRLEAETKGLRSDLSKAAKATQDATKKISKDVESMSEESVKHLTFFQHAMASMSGFVGGQLILDAFYSLKNAAMDLFNTLITDGIRAAQVQEDAINSLNTQLALNGNYSKAASKDMQDFASELQRTSKIGDETTLKMLSLASTFGKGTEETKKMVTAAVELSAATGMSLEGAIKNLGKTYAGMTGELGESLPIIRTLTVEQLKAGAALDLIVNRFGGSAASQIKTFSGLNQQLSNSFGDLTEAIGAVVTENQVLLHVMAKLNEQVNGTTDTINGNKNAYKTLVGEGMLWLIDVTGILLKALDNLWRTWLVITGAVNALLLPIGALVTAFKMLTGDVGEAGKQFSENIELMKKQLNAFSSENETSLGNLSESFAEMSVAGEKGLYLIQSGAESTIEPLNQTKEAVKALTTEEQKRLDTLKQFSQALIDNSDSMKAQYDMDLETLAINLEDKLLTEEEYYDARREMLNTKHAEELADLQAAKDAGVVKEKDFQKAKTELERQQDLESKKLGSERLKWEDQSNKERIDNFKSTMGTIASLSNSGSKELAAIGKASAITTATIDGYAAIQKALASAPPPFNFALAALVGVATAQNIAKIKGVGMNEGGTVPGTRGVNRDSVPIVGTPGEHMLDRTLSDDLRAYLERQSGGTGIEISLKDGLMDFIEVKLIERQSLGVSRLQTKLT